MNAGGDKMATTREADLLSVCGDCGSGNSGKSAKHGKGKPAAQVKFGSAVVPVYRSASGNRTRFTISFHREGKRLRQTFPTLDAAKKEAHLVAQRIQAGLQHVTDMKPHDRDAFVRAKQMLAALGIPLVEWLTPLPRTGRVIAASQYQKEVSALARALKIGWPHNVLRHSYISYRIAKAKSADQVALEAGNSPSIIFNP